MDIHTWFSLSYSNYLVLMVQPRDTHGRFIPEPIPHYNRGRTHLEPCPPDHRRPAG